MLQNAIPSSHDDDKSFTSRSLKEKKHNYSNSHSQPVVDKIPAFRRSNFQLKFFLLLSNLKKLQVNSTMPFIAEKDTRSLSFHYEWHNGLNSSHKRPHHVLWAISSFPTEAILAAVAAAAAAISNSNIKTAVLYL